MQQTRINPGFLPKDNRILPSEGQEQSTLFQWAEARSFVYPELRLMFHVPNGGSRSKAEAGRFKMEGVKAGVPDIFLPVPRGKYHGLFIEMKRLRGGKVSKEQGEWIESLHRQGYAAEVCHGWQEAAELICGYLGMPGI